MSWSTLVIKNALDVRHRRADGGLNQSIATADNNTLIHSVVYAYTRQGR